MNTEGLGACDTGGDGKDEGEGEGEREGEGNEAAVLDEEKLEDCVSLLPSTDFTKEEDKSTLFTYGRLHVFVLVNQKHLLKVLFYIHISTYLVMSILIIVYSHQI